MPWMPIIIDKNKLDFIGYSALHLWLCISCIKDTKENAQNRWICSGECCRISTPNRILSWKQSNFVGESIWNGIDFGAAFAKDTLIRIQNRMSNGDGWYRIHATLSMNKIIPIRLGTLENRKWILYHFSLRDSERLGFDWCFQNLFNFRIVKNMLYSAAWDAMWLKNFPIHNLKHIHNE